jgi:hypothetical protein
MVFSFVESGVMPSGISSLGSLGCFWRRVAAACLLVVLQGMEPEAGGGAAAAIPSINHRSGDPDRGGAVGVLPHPAHRGGGHDVKQRFALALPICRAGRSRDYGGLLESILGGPSPATDSYGRMAASPCSGAGIHSVPSHYQPPGR